MADKIKVKTRIPKQNNEFENKKEIEISKKFVRNSQKRNLSGQESKSYSSLSPEIQPKLIENALGNILELEADKIARDVLESEEEICPVCTEDEKTVSKPNINSGEESSFVQRKDTGDEKKKKEEEKILNMKENSSPTVKVPSEFETKISRLRGKGKEMPESTRTYFEPRFGYDFSSVRIHNDNEAARAANSINAYAFTLGRDIVFGRDAYAPLTFEGRRLLAHELTHVVQQNKTISPEKVKPAENEGSITPINNVAQTIIQRNGDEEADEIGKRALERITMITMQETAEWLDDRDFSFTDPRINQAAPKLCEAAKKAFKELKPLYTERNKAVQSSIEKVKRKISDLNAKSERTGDDDKLLEKYKSAQGALTSGKEIDPPEAVWNSSHCRFKKRQEERFAKDKLGQYKGEVGAAVSGAKTASQAYVAALDKFAKAKDALREKMIKLQIYDPEKNRIRPCVKPKGETKHPTSVSDEHVNKIKEGEGFAPLPYIALENSSHPCTIGYGHVLYWKRCTDPPESPCWEPGPGTVQVGGQTMPECITHPPQSMSEPQAHEQLKIDCNVHAGWIKDHVFVDLCQEQFDALINVSGHKGHTNEDLVKEIHENWCIDNEAVRKKYLETDLYILGRPEKGPVFKERRKKHVWPAKESKE